MHPCRGAHLECKYTREEVEWVVTKVAYGDAFVLTMTVTRSMHLAQVSTRGCTEPTIGKDRVDDD